MAVKLNLKYCPICGSFVKFDYSNGAIYKLITWRCMRKRCYFSRQDQMLSGWNFSYAPSIKTRVMKIVRSVRWWFTIKWAHHKIKKWESSHVPEN